MSASDWIFSFLTPTFQILIIQDLFETKASFKWPEVGLGFLKALPYRVDLLEDRKARHSLGEGGGEKNSRMRPSGVLQFTLNSGL